MAWASSLSQNQMWIWPRASSLSQKQMCIWHWASSLSKTQMWTSGSGRGRSELSGGRPSTSATSHVGKSARNAKNRETDNSVDCKSIIVHGFGSRKNKCAGRDVPATSEDVRRPPSASGHVQATSGDVPAAPPVAAADVRSCPVGRPNTSATSRVGGECTKLKKVAKLPTALIVNQLFFMDSGAKKINVPAGTSRRRPGASGDVRGRPATSGDVRRGPATFGGARGRPGTLV
jgi:hypothetical protein